MARTAIPIWWRLGSDDIPNLEDDYADLCSHNTLSDERPHRDGVDDAEWSGFTVLHADER